MPQDNSERENDGYTFVRDIEVPHFVPQIPDDLLENLSKREQHALKTMSVIAQNQDWMMQVLVEQNKALSAIERRQVRVEKWKNLLSSRWGLVVGFFALVGPYVFPRVLKNIFGP